MAWWDRIVSAAKSAVNKAVSAVKTVANTVVTTISNTIKTVTSSVSRIAGTIKRTVSDTINRVSSSVERIKNTIKESVRKVVDRVSDNVAVVKNSVIEKLWRADLENKTAVERIKEAAAAGVRAALDIAKERVRELDWRDKLLNALKSAMTAKLPWLGVPRFSLVESAYETIIGRELTEDESLRFQLKLLDWIAPLNVLSKLFFGKNLDGKEEEFGSAADYGELALGLFVIVPAGKIGPVAAKLGIKAGTALGFKGFMKFAVTKIDDAARLFKILNVDDQSKLIGKLLTTDEGVKIINNLLAKKALQKTLVKPTISLVNKAIAKSIITQKGFTALLPRMLKPKTILWGLTGMLGVISSAYGISFGTEWFAKEGLWELHSFPISDKLRDYRYEPTVEKADRIRKEIINLRGVLPRAQELVRKVAWLWPFTKDEWLLWADGIEFELDQIAEEFASIIIPELVKLPELAEATVRNIVDGDTIDVGLWVRNTVTGKEEKLPEYAKTDHARIRIVGINSPEKSPKGEILCSDVEIYNVEKKYADEARDRLVPLNDKKVILKIDPDISMDTHGRILAVVDYNRTDIGLRQIKEGLACGYYRGPHKFYREEVYSAATLAAKDEGIGMWKGLEEVEKEEEKIRIKITSDPPNARLFLDDVALKHNTPSDEVELSDVLHLFTLGKHVLSAEKGGLSAMEDIKIVKGDNGTIHLKLETEPIPEIGPEVPEIPEVPEVPPVEKKIMFSIDSTPTRAKVWIDDIYTHHLTPTNEIEQKDVIHLWTEGKHNIRLTKGGYSAEKEIELKKGVRLTFTLDLAGMVTPEVPPELVPEIPEVPEVPEAPTTYNLSKAVGTVESVLNTKLPYTPAIKIGVGYEEHLEGYVLLARYDSFTKTIFLGENLGDATKHLAHELTHFVIDEAAKGDCGPPSEIITHAVFGFEPGRTKIVSEIRGFCPGFFRVIISEIKKVVEETGLTNLSAYNQAFTNLLGVNSVELSEGILQVRLKIEDIPGIKCEVIPLPPVEAPIEEEIIEAVKIAELPVEYTPEQEWALREAFGKILVLTEGTAIMSAKEREELISSFNLHTTKQKEVLELLWKDLLLYTEGRKQLSADEYAELYDKYRMGGI